MRCPNGCEQNDVNPELHFDGHQTWLLLLCGCEILVGDGDLTDEEILEDIVRSDEE